VFDEDVSAIKTPLAAGLSAVVTVDTNHRRRLFGEGGEVRADAAK